MYNSSEEALSSSKKGRQPQNKGGYKGFGVRTFDSVKNKLSKYIGTTVEKIHTCHNKLCLAKHKIHTVKAKENSNITVCRYMPCLVVQKPHHGVNKTETGLRKL